MTTSPHVDKASLWERTVLMKICYPQNWKLRVSSLRKMAPLFAAYDITTYQQLIPNYLTDIPTFPAHVLQCIFFKLNSHMHCTIQWNKKEKRKISDTVYTKQKEISETKCYSVCKQEH